MILDHRLSLKKPVAPAPEPAPAPSGSASASTAHHETEKPPPYSQNSINRRLPPLPSPGLLQPDAALASFSQLSVASPDPPATVNQVHLVSKHEDIIGTFYVDPQTPSFPTKHKRKKHRKGELPNASFQTRSGGISLVLATTGNMKESPKATVNVTSRSGDIEIRLMPTPATRPRMGIDARSRSGDITIWFPETYSGVIQLNTAKGELHVLPYLAKAVRHLKDTNKEAVLLMGTQSEDFTDLCQITCRTGKITIGLSGQDKHPEKAGFWRKLSQYLRGSGSE